MCTRSYGVSANHLLCVNCSFICILVQYFGLYIILYILLICFLSKRTPRLTYPLQAQWLIRLASFQQFHPSTRLSFSTVDHHIVFGRPTFLQRSGVLFNTVSHLLFLSIHRICPTNFHLLHLTLVLIVFNFVFARIS